MKEGGVVAADLLEALQKLASGDFAYRLERTGERDDRDLTAFLFNSIAEEVQRIVAESTEAERRLLTAVETLTDALTRVAAGDFEVEVPRDGRGDGVDVLAFLVNNTIRELAILVDERERRAAADRRRLERALERRTQELDASEAAFRDLFEHAPVSLLLVEPSGGTLLGANENARVGLCLTEEEQSGEGQLSEVIDPIEADHLVMALREGRSVGGQMVRLTGEDREGRWGLVAARPLALSGQALSIVSVSDVSEHKQMEAQLRVLADRDALTGVMTRRPFQELSGFEVARCARYGRPLCVAMIDLDHFKRINDTHGHAAGDAVLRAVGDSLRGSMRGNDLVARFGGEEFIVLLRETTLEVAESILERLRADVGALVVPTQAGTLHVTASVGVAQWHPGEELEALVARADAALYAAKEAGRDRLVRSD